MPESWLEVLRTRLGDGAPDGLRRLTDAELRDLAGAIEDANRRQTRALSEAGERALHHIPRLLRGPVRRVVG